MQDLEKMGKALFGGRKGDDLRTLMESSSAKALEQKLDAEAVEKAARSGDAAALQSILTQVLSTEEGRALAAQLSKMGFQAVPELEERLNAVLSDPAQMEKIAQMASKLMGSIAPEEKSAPGMDPKLMGLVGRVAASLNGGGKTKLMAGLGPYLAEGRRARLEKALRLGAAASLAVEFMGELGGERNEPL